MDNSSQVSRSIADDLALVTGNFVVYLPLIFAVLGVCGFFGNVFTYLQVELRSNTYCIYSLCGSLVDIVTLCVNLFPNYLASKHGTIMWPMSRFHCKLNIFLLVFLPHLSLSILLVATIDRFAATCALTSPLRRLNQMKTVPWVIGLAIVSSCLSCIQAAILYDYTYESWCVSTHPMTSAILYIIFNGLMPPLTMFLVIFLTYRNVRQSRQRVGGANIVYQRRSRNQFIVTAFTQVLTTGFFLLQWHIMYMYFALTTFESQSNEGRSIIFFVYYLTNYCYYLNNVKSFYLAILTCRLFRQTFLKGLVRLLPRRLRPRFPATRTNALDHTVTKARREHLPRY